MKKKTAFVMLAVAAAALGAALAFLQARDAAGNTDRPDAPRSTFSIGAARAFSAYPLYNAGSSTDGLALTAVLRRQGSADYVSFVYGDCQAADHRGCAPPAEIQVWPACRRNLSMYRSPQGPVPEPTVVRSAPAAFFEGGRRLEVQTGRSTIVIFARSRPEVERLAADLRGVNVDVEPGAMLPGPAEGAVSGTLACGA